MRKIFEGDRDMSHEEFMQLYQEAERRLEARPTPEIKEPKETENDSKT
jgi:hypothetical protein